MTGILHFETFLLTGILLNLTPGNDTLFILAKSIGQGRKAGIVSALGIGTGSVIHTLLAAFGLSLLIAQSLWLFQLVKYAGAAYLLYMGYQMLRARGPMISEPAAEASSPRPEVYWLIYRDAILTNILNPKVALFFIAFLPQFIDPNLQNTVQPFLILGVTFVATGTVWCLLLAIFASLVFGRLRANERVSRWIHQVCGAVLLGLGLKVALSQHP
jgi:RhtB (resistance to homoserine/threonine) family protein